MNRRPTARWGPNGPTTRTTGIPHPRAIPPPARDLRTVARRNRGMAALARTVHRIRWQT